MTIAQRFNAGLKVPIRRSPVRDERDVRQLNHVSLIKRPGKDQISALGDRKIAVIARNSMIAALRLVASFVRLCSNLC